MELPPSPWQVPGRSGYDFESISPARAFLGLILLTSGYSLFQAENHSFRHNIKSQMENYLEITGEESCAEESGRFKPERSRISEQKYACRIRWKRCPRSPSFFSDCTSSRSSSSKSENGVPVPGTYDGSGGEREYKSWSKKIDTSELEGMAPEVKTSPGLSAFPKRDSTKYWGVKEPRRHWPVTGNHEYLLFPSIHPTLDVSSRYGRYFSMLHSSSAKIEDEHRKRLCSVFKLSLIRAKLLSYQLRKFVFTENMTSLSWFDEISKKYVITRLCHFLRSQRHLEVVSFENGRMTKSEGIVLLCALSKNGGDAVKELHIWKMFAYGQCPVLKDICSLKAIREMDPTQNSGLNYHFLEILNNFSGLTSLSVNYSYLADKEGDALLRLGALTNGNLKELRMLCLSEERPLLTNPDCGVGGYKITDWVWRKAKELNPEMRAMFVFVDMPQYENIILFLSKNIPMSSFYMSSGIDLTFKVPWEVDSTLLELRNWYSSVLESLSLHLWHHRDLLDYVLEYKILDEFPKLKNFEFIGVLKCLKTLDGFCRRLLTKKYKLKNLLLWVAECCTNDKRRRLMSDNVDDIRRLYVEKLKNIGIEADIKTFPA